MNRRVPGGDHRLDHLHRELDAGHLAHLADRPRAGALGHDRREVVGLGGRVEHQLAPDGEPEAADPPGVDIRPALQELDRGLDVLLALPAEPVRVAFALARAAPVEQQHPVAVPDEHPRLRLRAVAAGERDHRGTVPRRHVPALELEAVARGERHPLEVGAQLGLRHDGAPQVRVEVAPAQRRDDEQGDDGARGAEQRSAQVTPRVAVVLAAGPPQRHGAEPEQREPGGDREQPGVVVAGRADLDRVAHGLDAGDDAEHAGDERERPAAAAAQARVRPSRERERRKRHQAADEVIADAGARLRLQEVVVEHVQRDDGDGESERSRGGDGWHRRSLPAGASARGGGGQASACRTGRTRGAPSRTTTAGRAGACAAGRRACGARPPRAR